jgi:plastocyanin
MVSPDRLKGVEIGYEIVTVNDFRRISPLKLKAKKGTTVIWFNNGRSPLSIMFKGDQKVYVACKEPVSFVVGLDGSFVSTWIPNGATASLCFIEAGTYQYEVVYSFPRGEGTNRHTKGTVHIE